jgi:5-methylcytosine-specific restriction endonuclease McrA
MSRLSTVKPRLAPVRPRVSHVGREALERARDRARDADEATRRLYKTARWQKLRLRIFARDLYLCAICGKVEGNTARLVCDHVEPHRGDTAQFWAGPFQTLCKACHDGEKQRLERAAR